MNPQARTPALLIYAFGAFRRLRFGKRYLTRERIMLLNLSAINAFCMSCAHYTVTAKIRTEDPSGKVRRGDGRSPCLNIVNANTTAIEPMRLIVNQRNFFFMYNFLNYELNDGLKEHWARRPVNPQARTPALQLCRRRQE